MIPITLKKCVLDSWINGSTMSKMEEGIVIHSSILAWTIPWIEETGGLPPMESQRVRQGWMTNTLSFPFHLLTFFLMEKLCMRSESCLTLCDPMDCNPSGSSVHGIAQARILEWVAISSSRGSSWPRSQIHISSISYTGRQIFTTEPPGKPLWRNNISNLKTFSGFLWLSCWSLHSLICTQRSS